MRKTIPLIVSAALFAASMPFAVNASDTAPTQTESVVADHRITIAANISEFGLVIPSRLTAKLGEIVWLTINEREFERNGKKYRYEFSGWMPVDGFVQLYHMERTSAFFYMPDSDVTLRPVFTVTDITEYFNWDEITEKVKNLKNGDSLAVDMKEEKEVPMSVLSALYGKNSDVTFTNGDATFTVNGKNLRLDRSKDSGYDINYTETELTKSQRRRIGAVNAQAVKVNVDSEHEVTANLHVSMSKKISKNAYLYRMNGYETEFVTSVDVTNKNAVIPISESGTYILTDTLIEGIGITMSVDSQNTVPIVGGRLLPFAVVKNGTLTFTPHTNGTLTLYKYDCAYTDIAANKYRRQIEFVTARGLLDGLSDQAFVPNRAVTAGEIMRTVARLRGIPDSMAVDYCIKSGIVPSYIDESKALTHNELSVIFTNLVDHLIEYPRSFGSYDMSGFDDNAAAWVASRYRELQSTSVFFDKNEFATRADAAYMIEAVVRTVVGG